jgi:hypothetical protein
MHARGNVASSAAHAQMYAIVGLAGPSAAAHSA